MCKLNSPPSYGESGGPSMVACHSCTLSSESGPALQPCGRASALRRSVSSLAIRLLDMPCVPFGGIVV